MLALRLRGRLFEPHHGHWYVSVSKTADYWFSPGNILTWLTNCCETSLSPQVNVFYWPFQGDASFVGHFCDLCFLFVRLSCLFIAALWSPAGKGLTSWLSCLWCFIVFCHFPMRCSGSDVVLGCIDSWILSYFGTLK